MRFFLCINNEGSPASLEVGKVYRAMPEREAKILNLLRVIDESGEDYLYPAAQFVALRLPQAAKNALLQR
ncbi:MAG: hypothetical protein ACLPXM_12650 [Terriglobales bacterium]